MHAHKGHTFRPWRFNAMSKATSRVVVFHLRRTSHLCYTPCVTPHLQIRVKLNRVFFPR